MKPIQLDRDKVKKVTNASRTATVTMILLGFKQRAQASTNIIALRERMTEMKEYVAGRDYMDFWRGLEEAGAGNIILGRRGKPTRFEWAYSLRQIAKFAIEGKDTDIERVASRSGRRLVVPQTYRRPTLSSNRVERLVYSIPIRPDYTLEVNLPADISKEELEKIKNSFN